MIGIISAKTIILIQLFIFISISKSLIPIRIKIDIQIIFNVYMNGKTKYDIQASFLLSIMMSKILSYEYKLPRDLRSKLSVKIYLLDKNINIKFNPIRKIILCEFFILNMIRLINYLLRFIFLSNIGFNIITPHAKIIYHLLTLWSRA